MSIPAGWYPDPGAPQHGERWWDGQAWTEHARPRWVAAPAPQQTRPSGPTTDDGVALAGWWWRALALLIDSLVTGAVAAVATLPVQIDVQRELLALQRDFQRDVDAGRVVDLGQFFQDNLEVYADHVLGLFLLPLLVGLAYHAGFLRWKGATLGKLACGLRVRRAASPGTLPWAAIAARVGVQTALPAAGYALAFASGSWAVAGLLWLVLMTWTLLDHLWAAGARKRALHDLVAGTVVLRTR